MLERPMLTSDRDFEHYKRLFEVIRTRDPLEMLNEIKYSNLKGRGGAGFPAGQKFETCRAQKGSPKFVVCNADEGDPGSYSDRYLLEQQPHAVLFGMIASAMIVGANFGIVYIRAEYPESVKSMEKAIALWREYFSHQYPEKQQLPVELRIVKGAGSYICGEETALLSSLEGQRPEVRIRPPYPAESGLFLRPTVVNNVETLACIPYILEHGANAFIAFGTDLTAGVKLMSLDGLFNKPGIIEVAFGTPLQQVIYEWGGGFKKPVKALQIGGPLGGIIPVEEIENLSVDYDSFKTLGFDLGHASVVSIPKDFPMIKYLEHLFEFAAHESCGKCFPCRLGTVRGTELLQQAQESSIELELVRDLLTTLKQGSLCGLGTALPLPVENALDYFSEELKPYFNG
jgi:NADH-quinone oxidoreductase subunit F